MQPSEREAHRHAVLQQLAQHVGAQAHLAALQLQSALDEADGHGALLRKRKKKARARCMLDGVSAAVSVHLVRKQEEEGRGDHTEAFSKTSSRFGINGRLEGRASLPRKRRSGADVCPSQ